MVFGMQLVQTRWLTLLATLFWSGISAEKAWGALEEPRELRAYWISSDSIAVPASVVGQGQIAWLFTGNIHPQASALKVRTAIRLEPAGPLADAPALREHFPFLAGYTLFKSPALQADAKALLKEDLSFGLVDTQGRLRWQTGLQLFGILDEVLAYEGDDLGLRFDPQGNPSFKLWAPTAKSVTLHIYPGPRSAAPALSIPMSPSERGTWQATVSADWHGKYFLYEVHVFVPSTGKFERNFVTDPYSVALSANSHRSLIADLNHPSTQPVGWEQRVPVSPKNFEDIVLYELHIRDFSQNDAFCAPEKRGQYLAFTDHASLGMTHLRGLAEAGLTHVHLLPAFDFGSVNEIRSDRREPWIPAGLAADSPIPAELIKAGQNLDAFNWGYDPLHFFAPEGSYASDPDGTARILEFRSMVQGLHRAGLNVVMDMVFNHTFSAGQDQRSVLDRIVPGYYYRLDERGRIQETTCCADTASEHRMMEKLMADAVRSWARNYKVMGFRFDLMGHHTTGNLRAIRAALDRLTVKADGIDGKAIYLYGEGWAFGSLHAIRPRETATQLNSFGLGIGTFNDRIRDRIRGGSYMTDAKAEQGFVTGLFYDDNGILPKSEPENLLQLYADTIRIGMAGNLRDFELRDRSGTQRKGSEIDYNGSPAGYAARPYETVNYVSAHDNFELWDQIAAKAPFGVPSRKPGTATLEERVRMQRLGLALIAFSQGVPFFHAGSEILRSKSGEDNSYNSGDWFNRLDFSYQTNHFGVGLPPGSAHERDFWSPRLNSLELKPGPAEILGTLEYFRALLRIRKGSPLLRLTSLDEIQARLRFLETDLKDKPPGLLALALRDDLPHLRKLDPARNLLLFLVNVTREPIEFEHPLLAGRNLTAHREWSASIEPRIEQAHIDREHGKISLPPQSLLVLEEAPLGRSSRGYGS